MKVAKNLNSKKIPSNLTLGVILVAAGGRAAASFGTHFSDKIKLNVNKSKIDHENVYNGKPKLIVQNRNFMTRNDVGECMKDCRYPVGNRKVDC